MSRLPIINNYWSVDVLLDGAEVRTFRSPADDFTQLYFNIGIAAGTVCNRSINDQIKSEIIVKLKQEVKL